MSIYNFSITNLRVGPEGIRNSFEEFCCQLFRRAPEVPEKSRFRRVRGSGGDGGVEAVWLLPNGMAWGVQAKHFSKLEVSEKRQMEKSLKQAVANYPELNHYTFCLPFNLTAKTGAKAQKSKTGQHEKLSTWIDEWKAETTASGRIVEIDFWDETELIGRLAQSDPSGGLSRYWFDQNTLSDEWFKTRLTEAKAQAGKRYTPDISVETSLGAAFDAFGRSEAWLTKMEELSRRFSKNLDSWRRVISGPNEIEGAIPEELSDDAKSFLDKVEIIKGELDLVVEFPDRLTSSLVRDATSESTEDGSALESRLREALLQKHGPSADTPGFRQFSAEYNVSFPMAALDYLRELIAALKDVERLTLQAEGRLPAASAMLLRGEAGIGKTHGILDAAFRRDQSGQRSVVVFGEDIEGNDPWLSIAARLSLDTSRGRDSILDALNVAGESSGFPLVVFIDALNETQPDRRKWQAWLPPMLAQVSDRPFLKLCISCRDTYLREVIPSAVSLPTIEHNGFLGREYEALFAYFRHFGLGAPAEPLLQGEFANPLFLRLLCEALQASGAKAIPAGREGIRAIVNLLLSAKNKRIASLCDYDERENRVAPALIRLASSMASTNRRILSLEKAKLAIDGSATPHTKSLFLALESESLISTIAHSTAALGAEKEYYVRFTFERVGDHFIAEHLLSECTEIKSAFGTEGPLHFLVVDDTAARENAGLLEALAIQLPETHGIELFDAVPYPQSDITRSTFVQALPWRNPTSITKRTQELVIECLNSNDSRDVAFEAVLTLAARPNHPLNIIFIDHLLSQMPMVKRDPLWADMLERSYSNWTKQVIAKSSVNRIIDSARRGNLSELPDNVAALWATTLAWFCASPDRRIRDRATMALVCIWRARPATTLSTIQKFAQCEDEYISERVLVASYGAFLLNQDKLNIRLVASELYAIYFSEAGPPLNVSLRDHARLIIELAVELGAAPQECDASRYQPPYKSAWPLVLPEIEDLKEYAEDRKHFPQMDLTQQMGLATGTDFARYVVEPRVTSAFEIESAALDKLGLFRWFLMKAVELGYPGPRDQCAQFDLFLLGTFGGGRGRPGWAERLGKKYYWIFLRQLVGQLADHVPRKVWSKDSVPPSADLQGLDLRDLDPTDHRAFTHASTEGEMWFAPPRYAFTGTDAPAGDAAWIKKNDLPKIVAALTLDDSTDNPWYSLELSASWRGKRANRRDKTYRCVSQSTRTLLCDVACVDRLATAFKDGSFEFHGQGPLDYKGYLGEFPARLPYKRRAGDGLSFADNDAGVDFNFVALQQLKGSEWELDYNLVERGPGLLMPSPELINFGSLRWDCRDGWVDANGATQLQDPSWWSDCGPGLIVRLDYIDRFLKANQKSLVTMTTQMKFIAGNDGRSGRLTVRSMTVRNDSKTRLVERKVDSD